MLIKTVTGMASTNSAGQPVDVIPVRQAGAGETDVNGRPVDAVAVEESPVGVPVRVVTDKRVQNIVGQWVDTLAVRAGTQQRVTVAATETVGFSAHSFLAQAVDDLADAGDPFFKNTWAGAHDLNMMAYSSLTQRWDANGVDRTGSYSGALWLTEFANPYAGSWPAPASADGLATLQHLYWYALTAQAKGCKAVFIYPPWSPQSVDPALDANTMSHAAFWQQWLGQHVTIPVFVMPVPVIVRRIRSYFGASSPFKDGDDLHLSNSVSGTPMTATMASLGAGLIMMMTGQRLADNPAWNTQMRDLVGIVWDAIAEYACTGLGGATVVAPVTSADPLPSPAPL